MIEAGSSGKWQSWVDRGGTLTDSDEARMNPGDQLVLETPGGGGFGKGH